MECPTKNKICTRVLEKFLEGLEIFGSKKDFEMLFYSSDNALVGGKNHKTLANPGKSALTKEYRRHIPGCQECFDTYTDFLKRQIDKTTSIEEVDKKYFGLLPNPI